MWRPNILALGIIFLAVHVAFAAGGGLTQAYDGGLDRSGRYVVPGLTWQRAAQAHMDHSFEGRVEGQIVAQPLYWRAPGSPHGLVIVATEADIMYGLDTVTGRAVWDTVLGTPVPKVSLPCGNLDPVGITGTPVIDPRSATLYVDALVEDHGAPHHRVFCAPAQRRRHIRGMAHRSGDGAPGSGGRLLIQPRKSARRFGTDRWPPLYPLRR
jgi:hypothetical protein